MTRNANSWMQDWREAAAENHDPAGVMRHANMWAEATRLKASGVPLKIAATLAALAVYVEVYACLV